jgi:hypothetical protein
MRRRVVAITRPRSALLEVSVHTWPSVPLFGRKSQTPVLRLDQPTATDQTSSGGRASRWTLLEVFRRGRVLAPPAPGALQTKLS